MNKMTWIVGVGMLMMVALACQPPVSNEATLTVKGTILDVDGQPLANQDVALWKSDLPIFSNDGLLGIALAAGTPFRTVRTDADGAYNFEIKGAEANTSGQRFASYFAVSVSQGSDKSLAVASPEFNFSNQALNQIIPDLQFWDGASVDASADALEFTWDDAPTKPDDQEYIVSVDGGIWAEATSDTSLTLSKIALPADGETHRFTVAALRDGIRYRTSYKTFTASNPRGEGLDYKQVDNNNISATDCNGGNLFNLNDGVFAGAQNEENFQSSLGDAARCVNILLKAPTTLSDLIIHNGQISNIENASTTISVRPSADAEWMILDTQDGAQASLPFYYKHLSAIDLEVAEIKIEIIGGNGARFFTLGEVALYEKAQQ